MYRVLPLAIGSAAALAITSPAEAGFREQMSWQFRGPAELQTELNRETLRTQLNGRQVQGGATAIGLGVPEVAGTTVGNQTNGATSYTVNLNGSGNSVTIDGYLNLNASQQSEGQSASVAQQKDKGQ
ncbi:hypothetical protein [Benzoatithermus flavus]|uniref:Curli production assembly/transport component CsgF n=1 Tax=Benzoatithermus flavus TaxID=3108223 RepID=A0ABU8XR62_9PROT